jgi:hypothetical protein
VPAQWQRNVEHLLLPLVRNAIQHGIEPLHDASPPTNPPLVPSPSSATAQR